jgi:hypothetical protein
MCAILSLRVASDNVLAAAAWHGLAGAFPTFQVQHRCWQLLPYVIIYPIQVLTYESEIRDPLPSQYHTTLPTAICAHHPLSPNPPTLFSPFLSEGVMQHIVYMVTVGKVAARHFVLYHFPAFPVPAICLFFLGKIEIANIPIPSKT